ncbi:cell division protein FtsZ [Desulfitobacterium sp. AusDCA]|uniref:cell division protein FtsZ n=1 Tax=Desulfitobacterium sp. AusDCA TaxID=3240383 RepID=UPI003DA73CBC
MSIVIKTRPPFLSQKPINTSQPDPINNMEELTMPNELSNVQDETLELVTPVETEKDEKIQELMNKAQESFVLDSKVSIKFGVIGLGQAGGKIADAFASCRLPGRDTSTYPALAINTCVADLHALNNIPESHRVCLPNYELGAMRRPEIGYAAISQEGVIDNILDRVTRVFEGIQNIIVAAGIGGGTGTGTLQVVCDALVEKGFNVTTMVTFPRNLDSVEERKNSTDFFDVFQELLFTGSIASAINVDNNLLYGRYVRKVQKSGIDIDWKIDSNMEIVKILNEINATTGLPSSTTFDGAELTKILFGGGCVTFGKAQIELPDSSINETIALELDDILHSGYLANYGNLAEARYAGVQVLIPPELEFGTMMEKVILDELKQEMPMLLGAYVGHAKIEGQKNILIYSIVSGMGLPERAQEIATLVQDEVSRINEAETKRSQFTPTEINIKNPFQKTNRTKSTTNPFAKDNNSKTKNPFSKND